MAAFLVAGHMACSEELTSICCFTVAFRSPSVEGEMAAPLQPSLYMSLKILVKRLDGELTFLSSFPWWASLHVAHTQSQSGEWILMWPQTRKPHSWRTSFTVWEHVIPSCDWAGDHIDWATKSVKHVYCFSLHCCGFLKEIWRGPHVAAVNSRKAVTLKTCCLERDRGLKAIVVKKWFLSLSYIDQCLLIFAFALKLQRNVISLVQPRSSLNKIALVLWVLPSSCQRVYIAEYERPFREL